MPKSLLRLQDPSLGQARSPIRALANRVLLFLDEQMLEPTPGNYLLAYATQSDPKGLVAQAVYAVTGTGVRLTQAQADEIVARFAPAGAGSADDAAQAAILSQTLRLADLTAGAVAATGNLSRDLATELEALPQDPASFAGRLAAMIARSEQAERGLTAAAREVEALRQELESARSDANRDALTGLANRRGVEQHLARQTHRNGVTIALCDIDRFKALNDRYGHSVGDRVLKLVASALAKACDPYLVARWGGEEFLVIMDDLDVRRGTALIEEAREQLAQRRLRLRATDEVIGAVTLSAGVTNTRGVDHLTAIERADALLYEAKKAGRNRVVCA